MINTFNPEYTRIALQKKYGDPNSFKYGAGIPTFLNWSVADFSTQPDYHTISKADRTGLNFWVGTLSISVAAYSVGSYKFQMFTPETYSNISMNVVTAFNTAPSTINAPWQLPVLFNSASFNGITSGSAISVFQFFGYYFSQL